MKRTRSDARPNFALHPLAAATVLALLAGAGMPARAQFYEYDGSVGTYPTNLFPIDVSASLLDLRGNTLQVGGSAPGSFSALAGALLKADQLTIGNGGTGVGSVAFSGIGTKVELGGTGHRLEVGNWGNGSMLVSAGALVDATVNAAACSAPDATCSNYIGNMAGSTANLTVTGSGSEVRTLREFVVGGIAVFDVAMAGGTTRASVNVLNGGTLRTEGASIGVAPGGSMPNGTEKSFADVVIDGAGSRWFVTPNSVSGGSASAVLVAASHANARANITIGNGGQLILDGSTSSGPGDFMWLGSNGGRADLTISGGGKLLLNGGAAADRHTDLTIGGYGAGSQGFATVTGFGSEIVITAAHANLTVGDTGAIGQLDVLNSGRVASGGMVIGARGGTGTVNVNAGTIQLNGTDGRLLVGDSGIGTLVVSNGGLVDATLSPGVCAGNWCGNIVANHAGSTGLLTITGAGSEVRTLRGFDAANVYVDAFNGTPGASSTATINILDGGTLRTEWTSLGGGYGGPNALGTEKSFANVLIDGVGSRWVVTPNSIDGGGASFNAAGHANALATIGIGNGGQLVVDGSAGPGLYSNVTLGSNGGRADLTISGGGKLLLSGGVASDHGVNLSLGGGGGASSQGFATVTGTGSEITVTGAHARVQVGETGSAGQLDVLNSGRVAAGGLFIANKGGTGTVNVAGGTIDLSGTDGRLTIGTSGLATLTVSAGGVVDATLNPASCLGNWCGNQVAFGAGSTGTLTITGAGSEVRTLQAFNAAIPFVDGYTGTPGATSTANINILDGGTLRTEGAFLAGGPGGPNALGSERSFANVVIDGVGARWVVMPNSIDGGGAYFSASNHALAQSSISLSHGGQLVIDSTASGAGAEFRLGNGGLATLDVASGAKLLVKGSVAGNDAHMLIGGYDSGGIGHATVTGAGSELGVSGRIANLEVGGGGTGSLHILDQGKVSAGGLNIGVNGGTGSVTVDNARVEINNGFYGRLFVGSGGAGSLTVANGGVVDATVDPSACSGVWCGNYVGFRAGTTGTLTISGAGSEVRTLRSFNVADVWMDAYGGTPGGDSSGSVNILAGGVLRTEGAALGSGVGGPLALGTERSFANVVIDGAGSKWVVTPNSIDGGIAYMGMAQHVNATANVTVSGGGLLRIDGRGIEGAVSTGPNDGISVGVSGKATLTVTGAGSRLEAMGVNPFINVGASNATGDGTLKILDGGTGSTLYLNVGRNGAQGSLMIDGTGALLSQVGVGTPQSPGVNGPAATSIGRNGGTGQVTVSSGGRWLLSDGGGDGRTAGYSPQIIVGRGAGSTGSLTITGAGSTVELLSTSLGLPAWTADNFNPYVAIGYDSAGTTSGQLTVSNGGMLLLQGNAISTVGNSRSTALNIGGSSDSVAGGNGTALVTGPGSAIAVAGSDAFIGVGRSPGAIGQLTIADHGTVSATNMSVGRSGGVGTLTMDNGILNLSGQQTGNLLAGAGLSIGQGGGTGTATLTNGSKINITNLGTSGARLNLGGTGAYPLGNGTLSATGGSTIKVKAASGLASFTVGRDGTGSATFGGASTLDVGDGSVIIAALPGSIGTLALSGGSVVNAGFVGVGVSKPAVVTGGVVAQVFNGGTGHLVLDNSTINTTTFEIGKFGDLSGDGGVINATGDVIVGGTIDPGHSPGKIRINCNIITLPGSKLILDVAYVGGNYAFDELIIGNEVGRASTFDLAQLQIEFHFLGNTDPVAAAAALGGLDLDNFLRAGGVGSATDGLSTMFAGKTWTEVVDGSQITAVSSAYEVTKLTLRGDGSFGIAAQPVPEPATWAMTLLGLLAVAELARQRRGAARRT